MTGFPCTSSPLDTLRRVRTFDFSSLFHLLLIARERPRRFDLPPSRAHEKSLISDDDDDNDDDGEDEAKYGDDGNDNDEDDYTT